MLTNYWMLDNLILLTNTFGQAVHIMVVSLSSIWIGLWVLGNKTDVICGKKYNLVTSSGTELPLPKHFLLDHNSLQEWEIHQDLLHIFQFLSQSLALLPAIGMDNTSMNQLTDKKILQLFMHSSHSSHLTYQATMLPLP